VTILSRCQRFDLRRIPAAGLVELMRRIAKTEGIAADDAALAMIARAAEGSARDALSLLDQAIAHADGALDDEAVRGMLGLADRSGIIDLYTEIMARNVPAALVRLKGLAEVGADPVVVLEDLAAFTHVVTRLKISEEALADEMLTEEERKRGRALADKLHLRVLARAWQMLLKGIEEAKEASRPLAAADMVVVRLAHAADLPTPDEALRALRDGGGTAAAPPSQQRPRDGGSSAGRMRMASGGATRGAPEPQPMAAPAARPAMRLATFTDLVALVGEKRELRLKHALENFVRPIRLEPGRLELALTEDAPNNLLGELGQKLEQWTGSRWMVSLGRGAGVPTIAEQRRVARARLVEDARSDPLVAAVFARFPGAEIVDVRVKAADADAPGAPAALTPQPEAPTDEDD
jgi:DNA polymerase-3 subunit gamma/tau